MSTPISLEKWLEGENDFEFCKSKSFFFSDSECKRKVKQLGVIFIQQVLQLALEFQNQSKTTDQPIDELYLHAALESHPWYIHFKNLKLATSDQSIKEFQSFIYSNVSFPIRMEDNQVGSTIAPLKSALVCTENQWKKPSQVQMATAIQQRKRMD